MEYIFGRKGKEEILKTKGATHSNLIGYQQIEQKFQGQTIMDAFEVADAISTAEDVEGNCYDWYTIKNHLHLVDESEIEKEEAICEQDITLSARISDIEDALCDMDKAESEGKAND